ncbi:hypothetical protein, partial [Nodularia spumigena]
ITPFIYALLISLLLGFPGSPPLPIGRSDIWYWSKITEKLGLKPRPFIATSLCRVATGIAERALSIEGIASAEG